MIFKITKEITDLYNKNIYLFSEKFLSENKRKYYGDIKIGIDAGLASDAIQSMVNCVIYQQKCKIRHLLVEHKRKQTCEPVDPKGDQTSRTLKKNCYHLVFRQGRSENTDLHSGEKCLIK